MGKVEQGGLVAEVPCKRRPEIHPEIPIRGEGLTASRLVVKIKPLHCAGYRVKQRLVFVDNCYLFLVSAKENENDRRILKYQRGNDAVFIV